ncbi:MAG: GEVED domain-containing protein, partial [Bacteroidota bacterium]
MFIIEVDADDNDLHTATGMLMNTSLNAFDPVTGKPSLYILTAYHVMQDQPIISNIFISFDWEMATAGLRNGNDDGLRKLYKIPVEKVMVDVEADIVLLKVGDEFVNSLDLSACDDMNGAFFNAYAAGWSLSPENPGTNISHPVFDLKKIFVNPAKITIEDGSNYEDFRHGKYWQSEGRWDRVGTDDIESGASGSGLIDEKSNVAAVYIAGLVGESIFSSITNSWYYKEALDENKGLLGNVGLIDYLNPGHSWVNEVPGGYIKDMLPVSDNNLALSLNANQVVEVEKQFSIQDLFTNLRRGRVTFMDYMEGINVFSNPGAAPVYLSVEDRDTHDLYYGIYSKEVNTLLTPTGFKANDWDHVNRPISFQGSFNPENFEELYSGNYRYLMKNVVIGNIKKKKQKLSDGSASVKANYLLNTIVKLSRNPDGISAATQVRAVGIPTTVPINALGLFRPGELANIWRSKKYPESKGLSANELFINKLTVSQYGVNKEIYTGNNGGYLNLVNTFYQIGTLTTSYIAGSDEVTRSVKIDMDVTKNLPGPFYYKIWMDFFPQTDPDNNYNFVADIPSHPIELLAEGNSTDPFPRDIRMPDNIQLEMKPGETKICRLRVAISYQDNVTQNGEYEYGEVEDYLVAIGVPTAAEGIALAALLAMPVRAGIQPGQDNNQCGVPAQEPAASPPGTSVNVGDATYPFSCNTFVCASNNCAANAANSTTPLMGEYSVCISGLADYIALDEGDQFIHKAFSNRTVS